MGQPDLEVLDAGNADREWELPRHPTAVVAGN